jgi:hypothetical protein
MWTYDGSSYEFGNSSSSTREIERITFILAFNHDYTTEEPVDLRAFAEAYAIANHYKVVEVVEYAERCFNDFRSVAGSPSIVGILARSYDFKEL